MTTHTLWTGFGRHLEEVTSKHSMKDEGNCSEGSKYDAAKTLEAYSARLRDEADLGYCSLSRRNPDRDLTVTEANIGKLGFG
jgi:hypothetical protein